MENQNSGNKLLISLGVILLVLGILAGLTSISKIAEKITNSRGKSREESITKAEIILISQLKMKEDYGWKDVILWIESKESFEKAYGKKLNWMNYYMGFRKDPMCIDPIGGGGNWNLEKCCYNYVVVANIPDMLEAIANESKGKTLVVIGNTYRINDGENFFGNAYWCE